MYRNNLNFLNNKSSGFSLPVVIFIIVILSLIVVVLQKLSDAGSEYYTRSLMSNRAFYAAESGLQLSLNTVLSTSTCGCAGVSDINFSVSGLTGCHAEITCNTLVVGVNTYCTVSSTGRCNSSDSQRNVEVRVK